MFIKKQFLRTTLSLVCIVLASTVHGNGLLGQTARPIFADNHIVHPNIGYRGMVATQERHATQAAAEVLAQGGNAVDAAVTAGFALAVTLPRAGNIGGGGFMMIHNAKTGQQFALDYRERAPARATRDMYLDENGAPVPRLSRSTHLAVGVPGTVRGLSEALEKHGTITLKQALEPAIKLARDGFTVEEGLHASLKAHKRDLSKSFEARRIFFRADGSPWPVGSRLVQTDLAKSLQAIADNGPDAFYKGAIAKKIVADMQKNGGLISANDLESYSVVNRAPIVGTYRQTKIVSMPPPSSGGVHLVQMLNVLERFPLKNFGHNSASSIHVMTEAMRFAYADRSKYLGDPDFVEVPVDKLISKKYASTLADKINQSTVTASNTVAPGLKGFVPPESDQTTHFSVIDKDGNAVANTYTLNFSYGSRLMVPGTGILLNNEMDDFSAKPGEPNAYGLIGNRSNAIEPKKRMLSSMTPTFVFGADGSLLATGSPGGSRIITTVLQIIVNMTDFDMSIAEATVAPRFHHQWLPDTLRLERGFSPDTVSILKQKGHAIISGPVMGSTQSVRLLDGVFYGYSDPRRRDSLTIGLPANNPNKNTVPTTE
jgi:gamma-glutamyltranspeptidase/glutathione hydrolase